MTKRLLITSGLAVALITAVVLLWPASAISQATVFNHMDNASCSFSAFGGDYAGPATIVLSGSGKVNAQCNASLVAGSPVASATRVRDVPFGSIFGLIFCDAQYTTSGRASVACHN